MLLTQPPCRTVERYSFERQINVYIENSIKRGETPFLRFIPLAGCYRPVGPIIRSTIYRIAQNHHFNREIGALYHRYNFIVPFLC